MDELQPQDVIWRLLEHYSLQLQLLDESMGEVDPKKQLDLLNAIRECEQLTRTQINILRRMQRRYDHGG
ncbi:MAG: hypothetical protein GX047_01090 [Firmicutes bacterium]|nr:hypothetical protein [Bacillota bacterium]